jgi:hypothetical protein
VCVYSIILGGRLTVRTSHEAQLSYCREQLVPIWNCWTNGDPALARALASNSLADPAVIELRARLFQSACASQGRALSHGKFAALLAAQGVLYALAGLPLEQIRSLGTRAEDEANKAALASTQKTVRLVSPV